MFKTCLNFFHVEHKNILENVLFVHTVKDNGVQCCYGPQWLSLYKQKKKKVWNDKGENGRKIWTFSKCDICTVRSAVINLFDIHIAYEHI